ncbi:MAG: flippase [Cytophagales bacterium]
MNKAELFLNKHIYSRFFKRADAQLVANNTVWIIIDRLIRIALGMLTGVWVARYLGPIDFGKLTYVNSFVILFTPITNFSIDSLVVRDLAQSPDRKNEILGSGFLLKILASIFGFVAAIVIINFLNPDDAEMLWMVFILGSCFFFQAFDIIDLYFQSVLKSKYPAYVRTVVFVLLSVVKIILILNHAPLSAFVWSYFAEIGLGCIGLIAIYAQKQAFFIFWRASWRQIKSYVNNSLIMILQSFALVSQTKLDQIIVGQFVSENDLGQYSVAMRMVDMVLFLPMAIYASYAPKIAEAKLKNEDIYQSKLANLFSLLVWISIVLAVLMLIFGQWGIQFLFGQSYIFAGVLFSFSGIRLVAAFTVVAKSVYYVNENLLKHSLFCLLAGAIVNITTSCLLIPKIGTIGAIWANIFGFIVSMLIVDLFAEKTRKQLFFYLKSLLKFTRK